METRAIDVDRSEPGFAIVVLRGEHETYTADKLRRTLNGLLDEGLDVVCDLSEATFVDSSVVGVLLEERHEAMASGRKFAVVLDDNTGPAVRRLFELTRLDSVLPIVKSRSSAREHLL